VSVANTPHPVPRIYDYPTGFKDAANERAYYNGLYKIPASPPLPPARADKILYTFVLTPTEYSAKEEKGMESVYILHLGVFARWVTGDKHDCFEART